MWSSCLFTIFYYEMSCYFTIEIAIVIYTIKQGNLEHAVPCRYVTVVLDLTSKDFTLSLDSVVVLLAELSPFNINGGSENWMRSHCLIFSFILFGPLIRYQL